MQCRRLSGFQMLKDDEIVTSVQAESDPVDDETDEDEDNNESSKGPSNAGAFSALETAMEWYEQQSDCCPTQLLLLKILQRKNESIQCRQAASPLERWETPYAPQGCSPSKLGWTRAKTRTVTCIVLKAVANDRRTTIPSP
ncbi:hypothetical protein TNCV_1070981 [Trichonephila clavipes]|nr:hypothetical protein TNCV_1070981 [Trichonephila clavipes]